MRITSPSSSHNLATARIVCTPFSYPPFMIPNWCCSTKSLTMALIWSQWALVITPFSASPIPIGRTETFCLLFQRATDLIMLNVLPEMVSKSPFAIRFDRVAMTRAHDPSVLPSTACLSIQGVICCGPPPVDFFNLLTTFSIHSAVTHVRAAVSFH